MLPWYVVDDIILRALQEDVHYLDLSCEYLFAPEQRSEAFLLARANGVMCGMDLFCRVFTLLEGEFEFHPRKQDGEAFAADEVLLEFEGPTALLLQGERTALNLLQHLCGIATATARVVQAVAGTGAQVCDTRKTLPGLRALQKYAVTCGGGRNHRYNLSDAVMLKDNHIDACGSIEAAVAKVRQHAGHMIKIEVETRSLQEVKAALAAGADVIMLDNMSVDDMGRAVHLVRSAQTFHVPLEASGDITATNAAEVAATGVDVISLGAITHSVQAMNISMRLR